MDSAVCGEGAARTVKGGGGGRERGGGRDRVGGRVRDVATVTRRHPPVSRACSSFTTKPGEWPAVLRTLRHPYERQQCVGFGCQNKRVS